MAEIGRIQEYLRRRMEDAGITMQQLSLAMGRDKTYVAQLMEKPPRRSLPTPDELRKAAPVLKTPFIELLEVVWGIDRRELAAELDTLAAHQGELADLSSEEWDEVLNFVGYVRAKREMRRQREQNP